MDRFASTDVQIKCVQFLYQEAEYLDDRRFRDWLQLLTDDMTYEMPVRLTHEFGNREQDFSDSGFHMKEGYRTLAMRVDRLYTERAYAEDPPSRTTRMISNVRVQPLRVPSELDVKSNFSCYRAQGDATTFDLFTGERRDVLRLVDGTLKLASRRVLLVHTTLPTNIGLFF
ncbi:MAG: aromatic-ring-hydroxylating dioxygenase subunit beta [Rhodospirillaceae bacterium]|nr:aromatic-ring-hydroxylating dioxygenase subunit beta [Rhodospirillaceae bacterium]